MTGAPSVGALALAVRRRLGSAGITAAALEARLIVGNALGWEPEQVVGRDAEPVGPEPCAAVEAMVQRRLSHEPLAYILGKREFWSRDFAVSPAVLVPRPESETLIEVALKFFPDLQAPLRLADLGTGSGCLLVTLLALYPRAQGVGLDASQAALAVADTNARCHGVDSRCRLLHGDWSALDGSFDFIVANPPYIASGDIAGLEADVARYEPRMALDGGSDGLEAYRAIGRLLPGWLTPGGRVAMEVGYGQASAVGNLLEVANMNKIQYFQDLARIDRVVTAVWMPRI